MSPCLVFFTPAIQYLPLAHLPWCGLLHPNNLIAVQQTKRIEGHFDLHKLAPGRSRGLVGEAVPFSSYPPCSRPARAGDSPASRARRRARPVHISICAGSPHGSGVLTVTVPS